MSGSADGVVLIVARQLENRAQEGAHQRIGALRCGNHEVDPRGRCADALPLSRTFDAPTAPHCRQVQKTASVMDLSPRVNHECLGHPGDRDGRRPLPTERADPCGR